MGLDEQGSRSSPRRAAPPHQDHLSGSAPRPNRLTPPGSTPAVRLPGPRGQAQESSAESRRVAVPQTRPPGLINVSSAIFGMSILSVLLPIRPSGHSL